MDKVSEALQELIRQGGNHYWFGVRAIDVISGVLIAAIIIGGACFIANKIVNTVRECNKLFK